jgi:mRNA interferase RelE/StbE
MARHELRVKPSVAKDLRGIPPADVRRILERMEVLRDDPRAPGYEKPAGGSAPYRASQGLYRIVYAILDAHAIVEIGRVDPRGEAHHGG